VPHAAGERAPIAAVLRALLGPFGATLGSLAAMVSIYGWSTGTLLQSPRVLFAMAERGELPGVLARVHPRFRTPDVAIVLFAAAAFGFAAFGSFASNATFAAIVRLVYYALTAAALVVLRRRGGEAPGFRLPLAGLIVPLAVGFCLVLLATRTFEQAWILALLVLVGLPLRALAGRGATAA
jgi:amino acid transporter